MISAPNNSAITVSPGMPRLMVGMKSPCTEEWVEASGQATPSIAPWPNRSGVFDIFFSVAYDTNDAIVGPVPGISAQRLPSSVPRIIGQNDFFRSAFDGNMSEMPTLAYRRS